MNLLPKDKSEVARKLFSLDGPVCPTYQIDALKQDLKMSALELTSHLLVLGSAAASIVLGFVLVGMAFNHPEDWLATVCCLFAALACVPGFCILGEFCDRKNRYIRPTVTPLSADASQAALLLKICTAYPELQHHVSRISAIRDLYVGDLQAVEQLAHKLGGSAPWSEAGANSSLVKLNAILK